MEANKQSRNANRESGRNPHPWVFPLTDGWRPQIYERVLSKAWPLVIGPLVPYGHEHPAYLADEVTAC
jgi:hypothetical protein